MAIKLKPIFIALILSLITISAVSMDSACLHDGSGFVDLQGVEINYESAGDMQTAVGIQLNESYKGLSLHSVILEQGSWLYDKSGKEISAPDVSAELNIQMHNNRPFVQVFLSNTNQDRVLLVQYGERCGVMMKADLAVNKVIK